jgi:predicted  nucleic acid-binding Zn ribbon protein
MLPNTIVCPECGYTWTLEPGVDSLFDLCCRRCHGWSWLACLYRMVPNTIICPECGYTWTLEPGVDSLLDLRCRRCHSWSWLARLYRAYDRLRAKIR